MTVISPILNVPTIEEIECVLLCVSVPIPPVADTESKFSLTSISKPLTCSCSISPVAETLAKSTLAAPVTTRLITLLVSFSIVVEPLVPSKCKSAAVFISKEYASVSGVKFVAERPVGVDALNSSMYPVNSSEPFSLAPIT